MENWITLNQDWIEKNGLILTDYKNGIWLLENFLTPEVTKRLQEKLFNLSETEWRKGFIDTAMIKYNNKNKNNKPLKNYEDIVHAIANKEILDLEEFFRGYSDSYDRTFIWDNYLDQEWLEDRWKNIFISKDKNKEIEIDRPSSFERKKTGTRLGPHKDNDEEKSLLYATILYINEDFKGGDLYFEELDFSLKPKQGSLCIFDGFKNLIHEVLEIKEGSRYSLPIFIWDKEKREGSKFRNTFK